jgi:hypothetical protein
MARREKRNAARIHALEVELMQDADIVLCAISGTPSRKGDDKTIGRHEALIIGTRVNGTDIEADRNWLQGTRHRFHRGAETGV